jgi:hypothetical protein
MLLREVVQVESSASWVPFIELNRRVMVFSAVVKKDDIDAHVF